MRTNNLALRNAIFASGLTQRFVAKQAGVPEAVLSMIVNGKYLPDDLEKLRIAQVVGKSETELFTNERQFHN